MVLLDTETPGTSREIYSEDAEGIMILKAQLKSKEVGGFFSFESAWIKILLHI